MSPFYSDANKAMLGITDDTTLNQLIDGMMMPMWSKLVLWMNDNTQIGRDVRDGIYGKFEVRPFGYLTVTRNGDVVKMYMEDYENTNIYVNSYTSINNIGWYSEWTKK